MKIEPVKSLRGEIAVPGDKSISHRAVMLGALAEGQTRVSGLLNCDDCNHTIAAFRSMGARVFTRHVKAGEDGPFWPTKFGNNLIAGIILKRDGPCD